MLDAHEVKLLIQGEPLPQLVVKKPVEQPAETQRVLKPGIVRSPEKPLAEGGKPAPA